MKFVLISYNLLNIDNKCSFTAMIHVDYPKPNFQLKEKDGKEFIFDTFRKKWLVLTPEEWVRQNFLQYLIAVKNYPASLIAVEKEIKIGELKKRCDIIVYRNEKPWMIVECKEMNVPLSDKTVTQILNYNLPLQVDYLVVTNGNETFGLNTQLKESIFNLPSYT